MKPISEWTTEEIKRWMYAIGERSDRVISAAMDSGDWSEHDSDEKLCKELEIEMWHRGLYANGKPIPKVRDEKLPELTKLIEEGKIYEAQKLIISEFEITSCSDNSASQTQT